MAGLVVRPRWKLTGPMVGVIVAVAVHGAFFAWIWNQPAPPIEAAVRRLFETPAAQFVRQRIWSRDEAGQLELIEERYTVPSRVILLEERSPESKWPAEARGALD